MSRIVIAAAAQLGPIGRLETRSSVVERLVALLEKASTHRCELVVFPELALTTFFPRWWFDEITDVDAFFEREMPNAETQPLFDAARRLGIGFCLGYAELASIDANLHRFNSSILVDRSGSVVGHYRKIHLPGHVEHQPTWPTQHLERRYFETGNLGFRVHHAFGGLFGMAICNDRRWPESYRVMGLQGVELIMIGYNTPCHHPEAPELDRLVGFHNRLVMQAGAYQNGTWVVAAAKAGREEGVDQIGDSMIVAPSGEVVASCETLGDELAIATCDLDLSKLYKNTIFNFATYREPAAYRLIVDLKGAVVPSRSAIRADPS